MLAQPKTRYIGDYLKTQIFWIYVCTINCPIKGFHIYCGNHLDRDKTYTYYTHMVDIPDKNASNYLIGPIIDQVMDFNNSKFIPISLLQVDCRVVPYNLKGEAESGLVGVPNAISIKPYYSTKSQ